MITPLKIYWVTRLDGIREFLFVFGSAGIVVCTAVICLLIGEESISKKWFYLLFIPFLSLVVSLFVPTTKEMAAILILPKIANSETAKELGSDAIELKGMAMDYLKEKLKGEYEMKPIILTCDICGMKVRKAKHFNKECIEAVQFKLNKLMSNRIDGLQKVMEKKSSEVKKQK